jgi:hypothetical protein
MIELVILKFWVGKLGYCVNLLFLAELLHFGGGIAAFGCEDLVWSQLLPIFMIFMDGVGIFFENY